jgi:hypothetical protein
MKRTMLCLLFAITTGCSATTQYKAGYVLGTIIRHRLAARAGIPVYAPRECIGAVVNGVCHGSVIDTMPMRPRCYGTMIGGRCTGPMF